MAGIKKSCITKRELCITTRNDNDPRLKAHYKEYCNILNTVIFPAKRLYFNKIIETSNNRATATWKVIKNVTGNDSVSTNITSLNIPGKNIQSYQDIVNSFNDFFLDVAIITREGINKDRMSDKRPMDYTSFLQPFHKMVLKRNMSL
jgi:hypothetical protein